MFRNNWAAVGGILLCLVANATVAAAYSTLADWEYAEIRDPVENKARPVLRAAVEAGEHIYEVTLRCDLARNYEIGRMVSAESRDEPVLAFTVDTYYLNEQGAPIPWVDGPQGNIARLITGGKRLILPRLRIGDMKPVEYAMVEAGYSNSAIQVLEEKEKFSLVDGTERSTVEQIVRTVRDGGVFAMSSVFPGESWALSFEGSRDEFESFSDACAPLEAAAASIASGGD